MTDIDDNDSTNDLLAQLQQREQQLHLLNSTLNKQTNATFNTTQSLLKQTTEKLNNTINAKLRPVSATNNTKTSKQTVNRPVTSTTRINENTENATFLTETDDIDSTAISQTTQLRLYKAKITSLTNDLEKLQSSYANLQKQLTTLTDNNKLLNDTVTTQKKQITVLTTENDRFKKIPHNTEDKSLYETQITTLNKQIDLLNKQNKAAESDLNTKELKLNRATTECERLKTKLNELQHNTKDNTETVRKENATLQTENKKLLQQRNELIQAFKKQQKLVDILQKQKLHLQSAQLLQFNEQEFNNALAL